MAILNSREPNLQVCPRRNRPPRRRAKILPAEKSLGRRKGGRPIDFFRRQYFRAPGVSHVVEKKTTTQNKRTGLGSNQAVTPVHQFVLHVSLPQIGNKCRRGLHMFLPRSGGADRNVNSPRPVGLIMSNHGPGKWRRPSWRTSVRQRAKRCQFWPEKVSNVAPKKVQTRDPKKCKSRPPFVVAS